MVFDVRGGTVLHSDPERRSLCPSRIALAPRGKLRTGNLAADSNGEGGTIERGEAILALLLVFLPSKAVFLRKDSGLQPSMDPGIRLTEFIVPCREKPLYTHCDACGMADGVAK